VGRRICRGKSRAWLSRPMQCNSRCLQQGLDPYIAFAVGMYKRRTKSYWLNSTRAIRRRRTVCKPPVLGGRICSWSRRRTARHQNRAQILDGAQGYARNMGVELTQEQATQAIAVLRRDWKEVTWLWKDMERAAAFAIRHPGHLTGVASRN